MEEITVVSAPKSQKLASQKPVCVTGANGFVASHIVDLLLKSGYSVHGTVRSLKDQKKYDHLIKLSEKYNAKDKLKMFEASLTKDGSFDQAITGCEIVLHTASPYIMDHKDAQKDLVDPAIQGTLTVLNSCVKLGVRRVVVTSSVAAITDEPDNNKVYTEKDWNTQSSLTRNPYYYSKVLAEKGAFDFVKKHPQLELAVINPSVVIGPSYTPDLNQSNKIISGLVSGEFPGLINLGWLIVDVRDVAKAHLLAMESTSLVFNDDSKFNRFICCNTTKSMKEVVETIGSKFPEFKKRLPSLDLQCSLGDLVIKFASVFQPKGTSTYMQTNLSRYVYADNSKIKKELGLTFGDFDTSLVDTINDLIKWGHIKK